LHQLKGSGLIAYTPNKEGGEGPPKEENRNKQGVCHTLALPFTLKSILRQKKNYGNTQIYFTMQKYINLQKKKIL
jgi:hypothetical protein